MASQHAPNTPAIDPEWEKSSKPILDYIRETGRRSWKELDAWFKQNKVSVPDSRQLLAYLSLRGLVDATKVEDKYYWEVTSNANALIPQEAKIEPGVQSVSGAIYYEFSL